MSIESTLARVAALRQAMADPSTLISGATGGTQAPAQSAGAFAAALQEASAGTAATEDGSQAASAAAYDPYTQSAAYSSLGSGYSQGLAYGVAGSSGLAGSLSTAGSSGVSGAYGSTGSGGSRLLAAAETQIGQSEQPPGSNESPAIAGYRGAVAGSAPGEPWCADFASWAARQAGEPIGANGEGLGSVSAIWSWAQSSGRAVPNGPGVTPQPGDLIVFGSEHVGVVRGVTASGQIETVEGNFQNKVSLNIRSAGEATGYVSMS
ncbi:MAG TPA: CHAP domain-containing protein [Solirubrobacteraceae bacterium]|jgi:hypothetical protein|nr:CHAP domain-containing protein [Solirubrobacteraceae bacterium]